MFDSIQLGLLVASGWFRDKQMEALRGPYMETLEAGSRDYRVSNIKALCLEGFYLSFERFCFYLTSVIEKGAGFYRDIREKKISVFSFMRGALELLVFSPFLGKAFLARIFAIKGMELLVHLITRIALTLVFPHILSYNTSDKKRALLPLFKVKNGLFPLSNWLEPSLACLLLKEDLPAQDKFLFVLKITEEMEKKKKDCTNPVQKVWLVFMKNILAALVGFSVFYTLFLISIDSLLDRNIAFEKAFKECVTKLFTLALIPFFALHVTFKETKMVFSELHLKD